DALVNFLDDPEAWLEVWGGGQRRVEPRRTEPREPGPGPGGGRRRRRGRRGGRSRHRRRGGAAAHALGTSHNGEARSLGEGEQTAETRHVEAVDSAGAPGPSDEPKGSFDPSNRPRG
ncbi:MAG TPA: hypothetical protein VNF49_13425, partial [Candidatus Binataceae bacterium]|nr:hypothetical protein [Candidatus Binataceae bacterium]